MDFQEWLDETLDLQRTAFHRDPPNMIGNERADWFMMNFFAINTEVTEMSDETTWKPWVTGRGAFNHDLLISEAVDLMHFLANILCTTGCTGEELEIAYRTKMAKNRVRQLKGDDGVSRRCPGCGRSLDDVGIRIWASGRTTCEACEFTLNEGNES